MDRVPKNKLIVIIIIIITVIITSNSSIIISIISIIIGLAMDSTYMRKHVKQSSFIYIPIHCVHSHLTAN